MGGAYAQPQAMPYQQPWSSAKVDGPAELEHARLGVPRGILLRAAVEQPGVVCGEVGGRQKQVRQGVVSHFDFLRYFR